jgi:hypothetical protein
MIAIIQDISIEKTFFIKEWIDANKDKSPFTKYIDNRVPAPCIPFSSLP